MRRNPINIILTGIAVADLLMMVEYIPFAAHMYLLKYQGSRWVLGYIYLLVKGSGWISCKTLFFHGQDDRGGVLTCVGPFYAFSRQLLDSHPHCVHLVHTAGAD